MPITSGAAKATKVTRVKTPAARTTPSKVIGVAASFLARACSASKSARADRTVSSELEKGRERNVKVTGELAKSRRAIGE